MFILNHCHCCVLILSNVAISPMPLDLTPEEEEPHHNRIQFTLDPALHSTTRQSQCLTSHTVATNTRQMGCPTGVGEVRTCFSTTECFAGRIHAGGLGISQITVGALPVRGTCRTD